VRALSDGLARYGVSSGASRETSGNSCEHDALESELATWLGCEAVLLLPDGATANLALAQGIAGVVKAASIDELAHPSLSAAAAGAGLVVHRHEHRHHAIPFRYSVRAAAGPSTIRGLSSDIALMTDTVFSVARRDRAYPRAGRRSREPRRHARARRLPRHRCDRRGRSRGARVRGGPHDRVLLTSTLSKALGCYGGFIAGSRRWIEQIRTRSQTYIGTDADPSGGRGAARAASRLAFANGELVGRLSDEPRPLPRRRRRALRALGAHRVAGVRPRARDERAHAVGARQVARRRNPGAVRALPGGEEHGNFRIVVTAAHTFEQIDRLAAALRRRLGEAR